MGQDFLAPAKNEGAAVDVARDGVEGARQVSDLDDRGDCADEDAVTPERGPEVDEGADLARPQNLFPYGCLVWLASSSRSRTTGSSLQSLARTRPERPTSVACQDASTATRLLTSGVAASAV